MKTQLVNCKGMVTFYRSNERCEPNTQLYYAILTQHNTFSPIQVLPVNDD